MKRVIQERKLCEWCDGIGAIQAPYDNDLFGCPECGGHGEVIATISKEVDDGEEPERYDS